MAKRNPDPTTHAFMARNGLASAARHLAESTKKGAGFEHHFNNALDAIKHAGEAYAHAEGAADEKLLGFAQEAGDRAIGRAKSLVAAVKKNPADIPGGNMTACIDIMEARPDVDNAGALCNWLARRAGEYGGIRTGLGAKKKKLKPGQQGLLRRAMRL